MKIAPGVLAALAVIGALLLVDTCARRDERQKFEARQRDTRDDSTVSRLVHEVAVAEQRFQQERDSTGRVIRALRAKIAPRTLSVDTVTQIVYDAGPVDSLIASLLSGRAQDSLQILFWKSQVAQRDSVISSLQASRNAWRARSERRFACVGGPSAAMSLSGRGVIGVGVTCGWRF